MSKKMAHRLVRDRTHRGSVLFIEGIRMLPIVGARIVAHRPITLLLDLDGDFGISVVIHVEDGISVAIGFAMPVRIHGVLREHFYAVR